VTNQVEFGLIPSFYIYFRCACFLAVMITPPVPKRHIAFDTDATLTEAAQFLAQKANHKRAPLPPKRTSSFKDQAVPVPQPRSLSSHLSPSADDAAAGIMATSMTDSIDLSTATGADSLSDHQNRSIQSSSDDLLSSTPASQSRNGSLERILEHASSGPAADLQSAGCSSGEQKTPDTDASDASLPLPPPPPSLLVDVNSGLNTLPRFTRVTSHHQHGGVIADQNVLNQLRQSLKKTASRPRRSAATSSCEIVDDNFDSGHSSPKAGFYTDRAPRAVVSGYSTVPRSGATASTSFRDSIEQSTESSTRACVDMPSDAGKLDSSAPVSDVLHMPTPEVRRKVEEWQAGVERSLRASDDRGWHLKLSSWAKRASCQETDMLSIDRGDSMLQDRLSSDSSTVQSVPRDEQGGEEHNVKPSAMLRVSTPNTTSAPNTDACTAAGGKPEKTRWKLSKAKENTNRSSKHLPANTKPLERRHVSDDIVPKSEVPSSRKTDNSENSPKTGVAGFREGESSKLAAKSQKVSAVQNLFSGSDSPLHGVLSSSAKKSDSMRKKETPATSAEASSGVKVKPAKPETSKPNLPPGAKPVLPAFKPQLQSQSQSSPQSAGQSSLHHRGGGPADKETAGGDDAADCTKENVLSLVSSLSGRLSELSQKPASSAQLQPLADDVRSFHRVCSGYVESFPPHAKFQFREILATLERVAEDLRAGGGRDHHDRLLVTLQNSLHSIEEAALKK